MLNEKIFYAKSNGETIENHTEKVLKAYTKLKDLGYDKDFLDDNIDFIIRNIILFHDAGKKNPEFQNRMRTILKKENIFDWEEGNVPHEWLSPAFIAEEKEKAIKNKLKNLNFDPEKFFNFIIFVILSHHKRENQLPDDDLIKKMLNWINENFSENTEYFYNVKTILNIYNSAENWKKYFNYRIKWLGILLKCDYAASAGINPEIAYQGDYNRDFDIWLSNKGYKLKDFQDEAKKQSDKSVILIASTGIGKTECSINWINGNKAFYLLGIRIAVNEMYKRFKNIFQDNVVLLHGESSYLFAKLDYSDDEYEIKISKARQLSYPLTIATADQLVTSVFKYSGFEMVYFTASYSKFVIDEIQSFAPASIAAIVVFLKEIHSLGGRFMLMTATLPPFVKDEFNGMTNMYFYQPKLLNVLRHRIKTIDSFINSEENIHLIKELSKGKKTIIICNTVKKSQEMFDLLKELNPDVIHSRFIGIHRKWKERKIVRTHYPCIWITTQVVEASLDIDFDILFTENASIESIFQRLGRCYRNREYKKVYPNVYIFKSKHSNIYDPYIFNKTWESLINYDNKLISEEDKQNIIKDVFSDIEKTKYFIEYKKQKELLELGYRSKNKIEAEDDFRQITNNYIVIPETVFRKYENKINFLLSFIDDTRNPRIDRVKKQAKLKAYTIPIQLFGKGLKCLKPIGNSKYCKIHNIKLLSGENYTFEKGLEIINENEELLNNII